MSAPSRYKDVPVLIVDGCQTLAIRTLPASGSERGWLHTFCEGESLDLLARHYYGSEALWWLIADANPTRFPEDWRPGEAIRVPPLAGTLQRARR